MRASDSIRATAAPAQRAPNFELIVVRLGITSEP